MHLRAPVCSASDHRLCASLQTNNAVSTQRKEMHTVRGVSFNMRTCSRNDLQAVRFKGLAPVHPRPGFSIKPLQHNTAALHNLTRRVANMAAAMFAFLAQVLTFMEAASVASLAAVAPSAAPGRAGASPPAPPEVAPAPGGRCPLFRHVGTVGSSWPAGILLVAS